MASSSAVDNRPRIDVGMAALECAPAVPHEVLLSCSLPMALVHPESLDVIQANGEFASRPGDGSSFVLPPPHG